MQQLTNSLRCRDLVRGQTAILFARDGQFGFLYRIIADDASYTLAWHAEKPRAGDGAVERLATFRGLFAIVLSVCRRQEEVD